MLKQFKNSSALFMVITIFLVTGGCHNYYKATTRDVKDHPDNSLESLKKEKRYFVLRTPTNAYYMSNTTLSTDRKTLTCTLDSLPPEHMVYVINKKGKMKYTATWKSPVLSEVHLYVSGSSVLNMGTFTLSLDQVQKIEVIEKDRKRTTNSYVIGAIGYTLGAIAVAAIIIAATKSSCPFVSAYDGSDFALQGEIYGGAIYPQLMRHDYLPLKMWTGSDGNLQLKISNELQERQFTDMADLVVVKHDKNTKVICDAGGKLYNIQNPQSPYAAFLSGTKDVKDLLLSADKRLLYFDDSTTTNGNNYVVLQFNKEENIKKGKLILCLKNSYWLDYLYGELAKGFGNYYNTYAAQQHKKPVAQLNKWTTEQQIPLEVSIKTNNGWQKITSLTTMGPVATRDIVIPVDLSSVKDSRIEIKLSSGYLFWELDYAAMDFSPDKKTEVTILKPFTAHDETGKDVLNLITNEDNRFLEQPVPGTVTTLEYKWKPSNNNDEAYTFILHTKGYYEHVRNFKGSPDKKFLEGFKKPGAFPQFSLQRFKQFNKEQMEALSKN